MFIQNVLAEIWKDTAVCYQDSYSRYQKLGTQQLYEHILSQNSEEFLTRRFHSHLSATNFATVGCPNFHKGNQFGGCCFCDFFSENIEYFAMMSVLKDKCKSLYNSAVHEIFLKSRHPMYHALIEQVTAHDTLNPLEIPSELFIRLFSDRRAFPKRMFKCVIETRASSVTSDRLALWNHRVSSTLHIEFGVEVANEWIRNHWLNKNIDNQHIENALSVIRSMGYDSDADILMGIPGLSEGQSLQMFLQSFEQLAAAGADYIVCSPLLRKGITLQNHLYKNLRDNPELSSRSLTNGAFTGTVTPEFVVEALFSIARLGSISEKLIPSSSHFTAYLIMMKRLCEGDVVRLEALKLIESFFKSRDFGRHSLHRERLMDTPYADLTIPLWSASIEPGKLIESLDVSAKEIAKSLWTESWEERMKEWQLERSAYEA